MGARSAIEWTHATWNPWRGCDRVSPGCAHCYMGVAQRRYGRDPWTVVRCSPQVFGAPLSPRWARERDAAAAAHGRHLVFACSWSDWFHPTADPWREEAWDIVRATPGSTYQLLTKRPERIAECLPADWGTGWPNVWVGVTVENRRYVQRVDALRSIPATVRFVSAEPLLGPLLHDAPDAGGWADGYQGPELDLADVDWLITGGESGPGHRRVDAAWVRALRDACTVRDVAYLHKQWGGATAKAGGRELDGRTWEEIPA